MEILKKGNLPDGITMNIVVFNNNNKDNRRYYIHSYPIAYHSDKKENGELTAFSPREGEKFLYQLHFETFQEAQKAFDELSNGSSRLIDYSEHAWTPRHTKCLKEWEK